MGHGLRAVSGKECGVNCHKHPDRVSVASLYAGPNFERIGYCKECADTLRIYGNAFGTGISPQAHAEAQEARRYANEWERHKATYREIWRK